MCPIRDCPQCRAELAEFIRQLERYEQALRIIAGQEQCIDNLMSNADAARSAPTVEPVEPRDVDPRD